MKHPALARVLAAMLAVFSLVLCFSGAYGITRANKEKDEQVRQYELLVSRTEEYKKIYDSIVEEKPFDEADRELSEKESEHNKSASGHKADVATYSATKGGIKMGEDLLAQGEAMINMITPIVAVVVGVGTEAINTVETLIYEKEDGSVGVDVTKVAEAEKRLEDLLVRIGVIQPGVLDYESKLKELSELRTGTEQMKLELADLQARQAEEGDPQQTDSASETDPSAEELPEVAKFSDNVALPEELQAGEIGEPAAELESAPVAAEESAPAVEQAPAAETQESVLPEMPPAELNPVQAAAADAAVPEAVPVVPAQPVMPAVTEPASAGLTEAAPLASFSKRVLVCSPLAFEDEIAKLIREIEKAEARIAELSRYIEEHRSEYEQLKKTLEEYLADYSKLKSDLDFAKSQLQGAAIELTKAYSEIIDGYWEIEKQKAELKEKRPELEEEKTALDNEYAEITSQKNDNEQLKQAESRMTSLRVLLTKNERIRSATDSGENLITASENEIPKFKEDYESRYNTKMTINILGFAAAVFALLGIPAAFEKWRSRFLLIVPVLAYIACTAAAEVVSVKNGIGQAYVPLISSVFGLFQLITVIPKKKVIHT